VSVNELYWYIQLSVTYSPGPAVQCFI